MRYIMKPMKLLLSSILGFSFTISSAHTVGVPLPEPDEYMRAGNAFGTGYFTIPGTDGCLRIQGLVF